MDKHSLPKKQLIRECLRVLFLLAQSGVWMKMDVAEVFIGSSFFFSICFLWLQTQRELPINTAYKYNATVLALRLSCGDKRCLIYISHRAVSHLDTVTEPRTTACLLSQIDFQFYIQVCSACSAVADDS